MKKYLFLVSLALLFACEKEVGSSDPDPEPDPTPVSDRTNDELIRDSIYYYYNLYSYWTQSIPDYEDPYTFSSNYGSNQGVLDALMVLTPTYNYLPYTYLSVDPGTHYDRYSFIQEEEGTSGQVSITGLRMDTNEGYGMYFGLGLLSQNGPVYLVIYFVEGGSPASQAGITRGSVVYAINDDTNVTMRYENGSVNESDYNTVVNKLLNGLESSSLKIKAQNIAKNEAEKEYTLTYRTYDIDPILADTVYKYPAKNIGYLAFSSFEETDVNTRNRSNFETIFTSFAADGIKELILDMRYNTGGYVSTAEYLANKLINESGNGKLMFTYDVNAYLSQYKSGNNASFADVYYARNNQLSLDKIYVLATESTASAAELLINVLKPYIDVVIIAETDRTYGKPVGFFEQKIMSSLSLWATSFKTINANNDPDYWDGLAVDKTNVDDNIFYDFGDPSESMIKEALTQAGVVSSNRSSVSGTGASSKSKLGVINKPEEKNMLKTKD